MFSGLRQNSLFYVLDKSKPTLRIGQVVSVSNPQQKFPSTFVPGQYNPNGMETTVDVKVKFDDDSEMDFKQLPSNNVIANDQNMVVSENKDAMIAEVDGLLRTSRAILESIDFHKGVVESCEGMLSQLNPQIAKEKEQAEKISKLEHKVDGMEGTLSDIKGMLKQALQK